LASILKEDFLMLDNINLLLTPEAEQEILKAFQTEEEPETVNVDLFSDEIWAEHEDDDVLEEVDAIIDSEETSITEEDDDTEGDISISKSSFPERRHLYPRAAKPGQTTKDRRYNPQVKKTDGFKSTYFHGKGNKGRKPYRKARLAGDPHSS